MPNPIYASSLHSQLAQPMPDSTPSSTSSASSNMASVPFRFRRKSFSDDSSPLPSPSSSPLKSSYSPRRPLSIYTTKYRPQYSLSPPGSPQDASEAHNLYSPTKRVGRLDYRLPSFKSMFGDLNFDSHLTDDEDVPPSSEYGYNPSEYDFSDSEPFEDKVSPIFPGSVSPADRLFSDSCDRRRRPSASSEQEEDAIIGLLDLRRRSRLSSFPESGHKPPSLAAAISPETESENLMLPSTPDDDILFDTKEEDHKIMLVHNHSVEDYSASHPYPKIRDKVSVKMEIIDSIEPSKTEKLQVKDPTTDPGIREPSLPPVDAVTANSRTGSPFAIVRAVSPVDIRSRDSCDHTVMDTELQLRNPSQSQPLSPPVSPERGPKCAELSEIRDEISLEDMISHTAPHSTTAGSTPQLRQTPPPHSQSRLPSASPGPSQFNNQLVAEQSQLLPAQDFLEAVRALSPLSDISAQDINERKEPQKNISKRRSPSCDDARVSKKIKRESEAGPSERPLKKTIKKPTLSTSHKRKDIREQRRRAISPLPTCSSLSSVHTSLDLEPEERLELIGMVIETLAMTRASSMDGEGVWRGVVDIRPNLLTKRSKREWMKVLYEVLDNGAKKGFFGTVASSGKDERNNPLPPRYFYVPEKDPDEERASLLKNMMPRPSGRRSESVKYKQYYWKPLEKWSRWDAEEEI